MVPKTTVAVVGRVHRAPDREPRRGARGHGGRPGRVRELRHPRGRARSGSVLGPVAIVAADTAGRRADRIESLLSARLFVEPQLATTASTFASNLSGHLSLYAMDADGRRAGAAAAAADRAAEPGARRRPSLPRASATRADPRDARRGRRRELRAARDPARRRLSRSRSPSRRSPGGRSHLVDVDDDAEIAFFAVESREESVDRRRSASISRPARAETLWQSPYGALRRRLDAGPLAVVLADGYTMGDVVLYEVDGRRRATMLYGTPIEERDPDGATIRSRGFRRRTARASGSGPPADDDALRRHGLARLPRPLAARRGRAGRDRRARARGRRRARGARAPRGRSLRGDLQHRRLLVGVRRRVRRGRADASRSSACSSARASSRAASCTGSTTTRERPLRRCRSARRRARRSCYVLPADGRGADAR